jgi:hypothetical protein
MSEVSGNRASLSLIFDLLVLQGWLAREQTCVRLTPAGLYAAQIATSYGVTVSYLPLLNVLSTLLFGNPRIPRVDETGSELLVNRGMFGEAGARIRRILGRWMKLLWRFSTARSTSNPRAYATWGAEMARSSSTYTAW